jgi:hypothetical protein
MPDEQRVRSRRTSDVLRRVTYNRCKAQLEFLNGFDSALFLHCSRFVRDYIRENPKCWSGRRRAGLMDFVNVHIIFCETPPQSSQ